MEMEMERMNGWKSWNCLKEESESPHVSMSRYAIHEVGHLSHAGRCAAQAAGALEMVRVLVWRRLGELVPFAFGELFTPRPVHVL